MDFKASLFGGVKALLAGSLVGAGLPMVFTAVIGIGVLTDGQWEGLLIVFAPFLVALAGGAIGMVLIGLPLTLWLRRRARESLRAYIIGGVIGGLVLTMAVLLILGGTMMAEGIIFYAFGMLTGAAIAGFWWRFARKPAQMDETEKFAEIFS